MKIGRKMVSLLLVIIALLLVTASISSDGLDVTYDNEVEEDINKVVDKNIPTEKINIIGTYNVKDDKKSKLIIKEEGKYELSINVCEKYLNLFGTYEIADKKLKLLNHENNFGYYTIDGNTELSFTVIDENTIRLDEDLECLFQNTVFER